MSSKGGPWTGAGGPGGLAGASAGAAAAAAAAAANAYHPHHQGGPNPFHQGAAPGTNSDWWHSSMFNFAL